MTEIKNGATMLPEENEIQQVTLRTVKQEDVNLVLNYLQTKPYGEVVNLIPILISLYASYKNNTELLLSLQPSGEVTIDDI